MLIKRPALIKRIGQAQDVFIIVCKAWLVFLFEISWLGLKLLYFLLKNRMLLLKMRYVTRGAKK